jgi:multidrug efflux system outer membrane protein
VSLRDAGELSRLRYDQGLSTYLEVLYADQELFRQELQLARTRGAQLRVVAQLYRALGGGWQAEATPGTPGSPGGTPPPPPPAPPAPPVPPGPGQ